MQQTTPQTLVPFNYNASTTYFRAAQGAFENVTEQNYEAHSDAPSTVVRPSSTSRTYPSYSTVSSEESQNNNNIHLFE